MSRRALITDLSPATFAVGQGIYAEDLADVVGMMAYAQARSPEHLFGWASGEAGWGTASSPATHSVTFSGTSTTVYELRCWIDPDTQSVRVAARADVPAGSTCTVVVTVGTSSATLTFVGATTTTTVATADLATSATGTGLTDVKIDLQRTVGSGACELLAVSGLALHIADVDLPQPPDE